MTPQRRARVVVRSRDPRLRSLIIERLRADGGLDVTEAPDPDAMVEVDVGDEPEPNHRLTDPYHRPSEPDPEHGITPREHEVLGLLAEGQANKEIAATLGISTHTAKFHVESLLRKLGAANRAEAVHAGIRRGLIGI